MAIRFDKDSHIVTITINRPEAMNAMDRDTSRELAEAFEEFDQDADLLVAILTGAGDKAFSAGADLKKCTAVRRTAAFARSGIATGSGVWDSVCTSGNRSSRPSMDTV